MDQHKHSTGRQGQRGNAMTMKDFIKKSSLDGAIVRAVVKQLGGWTDAKESMLDIARHGIDGGFHGFVYYADTIDFFKRNKKSILAMADEYAREFGHAGALDLFSSFNCMKEFSQDEIARAIYAGKGDCKEQIMNCLAWFAGEEVSRSYYDICEG